MGVFTGEVLRAFSSPLVVPFNTYTYAKELLKEFDKFKLKFKPKFDSVNITLDDLEDSIKNLIRLLQSVNLRVYHNVFVPSKFKVCSSFPVYLEFP